MPRPPALMPMPERPRMSSMLPRSPGVHLIGVLPPRWCVSARSGTDRGSPAIRRSCLTDVEPEDRVLDLDVTPFALLKAQDGKQAPRGVPEQDGGPDTGGLQLPGRSSRQKQMPSGSSTWEISVM